MSIDEIRFTPRVTVKDFSITINGDSEVETLETFYVNVHGTLNTIVLTPRIQVDICGVGKSFSYVNVIELRTYMYVSIQ